MPTTITIRLPPAQRRKLSRHAEMQGVTVSTLLRRFVEELPEPKPGPPDWSHLETAASRARGPYQADPVRDR
ncbi:MAG TPA: hypothetical protein PKE47_04260 [Verrucomicrobiota bacterium]|nr:hypothetical protein [Verrucomicrobiota bacterium]